MRAVGLKGEHECPRLGAKSSRHGAGDAAQVPHVYEAAHHRRWESRLRHDRQLTPAEIGLALQWSMLADSTLSFNTIHDRTKRCETAFLNGTWLADRLAAEAGLDIESGQFAHGLWEAATSAFSLERWVAERKFGPHVVVAKTPIANIRLTTFFAGEAEVRLVDPWQLRLVESVGCTVAT